MYTLYFADKPDFTKLAVVVLTPPRQLPVGIWAVDVEVD